MKQPIQPQNSEKIKQTASQLREIATRFDAQILILDELMIQVEAENRDYLMNYTQKVRDL
jgi:hypothetical protein